MAIKAQAMHAEHLQFRGSQVAQLGKRPWRAAAGQSSNGPKDLTPKAFRMHTKTAS